MITLLEKRELVALLSLALVCGLCTLCHGMFPLDVIDITCPVILAIPGQFL